jgi:RecT family
MTDALQIQTADPGGQMTTQSDFDSRGLLMDFEKIRAMQALAEIMSTASVTVPAHFRGKPGDCLAVVMQSSQWGMNPFAVAQKTHIVNGALGYEAQLVNAVVQTSGAIVGRFHYEFKGDGASAECRVGAVITGERDITWGEWLKASDVTTKNSPLWKTNVKQQLGYLQVKNWARAHTPGAILGVYTPDELQEISEREINPLPPKRQTGTQAAESAKQADAAAVAADDSEERAKLIADLELVAAEQGIDVYANCWKKLTSAQRKLVGADEHDRLKKIAGSIPADVDRGTGEIMEPGSHG